MAKKENIDIDESELLGFMSAGQQQYKSATVNEPTNESEEASESTKKTAKTASKKNFLSFDEKFLVKRPSPNRCQTYIDRETYSLIKKIIPVIAPDITIAAYVNNILTAHLDEYWEEINRRYQESLSTPLKRK